MRTVGKALVLPDIARPCTSLIRRIMKSCMTMSSFHRMKSLSALPRGSRSIGSTTSAGREACHDALAYLLQSLMALYSHSNDLLPAEVTEPIADFLSSGMHQVERVLKGPRARSEVTPQSPSTWASSLRFFPIRNGRVRVSSSKPGFMESQSS